MLLEFAAFVALRIKKPDLHRPYKVPLQTFGVTILCIPPAFLLVLVMCLASLKTVLVSGSVIILGVILYITVVQAKERNWIKFESIPGAPCVNSKKSLPVVSYRQHLEVKDEASASLLSEFTSLNSGQQSSENELETETKLD
ncbi:hypothetical protein C5167_010063 [Papaver somniferum]|uniref:Uncharacterized protein n=2 Tax=Papaver somniferum TaxID=3469 RepID=A0A4Y7K358_PAPSO|nr:hypothetical protein C5167_010063 [Papaver somniferum]